MGFEQTVKLDGTTPLTNAAAAPDLAHLQQSADLAQKPGTLATNASAQQDLSFWDRYGVLTLEGAQNALTNGVGDAVKYDLTHLDQTAKMVGSAALFGAATKILLPESGLITAAAGLGMMAYFGYQSAKPIIQTYKDAGKATNKQQIDDLSKTYGDAVGSFAVNSGVSILGYGAGAKATEWGMKTALGDEGMSAFNGAKNNFYYGENMPIGKALNWADVKLGGRLGIASANMLAGSEVARANTTGLISDQPIDLSKVRAGKGSVVEDPSAVETLRTALRQAGADATRARQSRGNYYGLTRILDGHQTTEAGAGAEGVKPADSTITDLRKIADRTQADLTHDTTSRSINRNLTRVLGNTGQPDLGVVRTGEPMNLVNDEPMPGANNLGDAAARRGGAKGGKTTSDSASGTRTGATSDATTRGAGDQIAVGDAALEAKILSLTKPENIGKLTDAVRQIMSSWTLEQQQISDFADSNVGKVYIANTPGALTLPEGYRFTLQQVEALANAMDQDPQAFQEIAPILDGVGRAAQSWQSYGLNQTFDDVHSMNVFGAEHYTGLVQKLLDAGLKPEEVRQMVTQRNPSLFLVRSDGTNPETGDGGQGPYTIPTIKDEQGNDVLGVATVYIPRNMSAKLISILADGIYGHELGHDQIFGGLAKLPESIRDQVIDQTVSSTLGDRANNVIKVPSPEPVKPGEPVKMLNVTEGQLVSEILKAWANEVTADYYGTRTTTNNTGAGLVVLLKALRDHGMLDQRSIYTPDLSSQANPLGLEAHPTDVLRPFFSGQVLAQAANGDPLTLAWAKAMQQMSVDEAVPGDKLTWARLPQRGSDEAAQFQGKGPKPPLQTFSLPKQDLMDVMNELAKVQSSKPLDALGSRTFNDIMPDAPKIIHGMDSLSDDMVGAIKAGKEPSSLKFDPTKHSMNEVLGSGLMATLKLIDSGMPAMDAIDKVDAFSIYMRRLSHQANPTVAFKNPLAGVDSATPLHPIPGFSKAAEVGPQAPEAIAAPQTIGAEAALQAPPAEAARGSASPPYLRVLPGTNLISRIANGAANSPLTPGILASELLALQQAKRQMLEQHQQQSQ